MTELDWVAERRARLPEQHPLYPDDEITLWITTSCGQKKEFVMTREMIASLTKEEWAELAHCKNYPKHRWSCYCSGHNSKMYTKTFETAFTFGRGRVGNYVI